MSMIHSGLSRVSTPVQRTEPPPDETTPTSPMEDLLAPRRSRKRLIATHNRATQQIQQLHGTNPIIQFQLPSNAYTGTSPPTSPVSMLSPGTSMSTSPLRQGNNSSVLSYNASSNNERMTSSSSSAITSSTVVQIDRSKTLKSGVRKHRARILTVGPKDVVYAGQMFNETSVSDVGNFSLSDVIGRNYTPSSAGLTVRVVQSLLQGAPTGDHAKEVRYKPPPLPLGVIVEKEPWEQIEDDSDGKETKVPSDETRIQDEKSLTFEINQKTGFTSIHAMRQKTRIDKATTLINNKDKFDPYAWNPRGVAPKVVLTTAKRLKNEMSKSKILHAESSIDLRDEDNHGNNGNNNRNVLSSSSSSIIKNGKWSLTSDPSYFESTGTYNDSIVNDVHQSSLIGTITGTSTLGHLQSTYQPPIQINSLIKNRLALNAHQETSNHKKADYELRKQLISNAIYRMRTLPSTTREQKVLLFNLRELAYSHRVASTRAAMTYDGMLGNDTPLIPFPKIDPNWKKSRIRLNAIRIIIENTLCVCEPLQRDLQSLWDTQSKQLTLNVVDSAKFQNDLPMPLSDFSSMFIESVIDTRKTLREIWIPETLRYCLSHLVAFLRHVIRSNQLELNRKEMERSQLISENATRWMPSDMTKSLKLELSSNKKRKNQKEMLKPITQKSRVAQEFVHLREPDVLYKAREPKTVEELEVIMSDSLQSLCNIHDDTKKNVMLKEKWIDQAASTLSSKSNYILDYKTTKIKCERLLSCAGALMSKQIRSVADTAIHSICTFFRSSISNGQDSTRTSHSKRPGTIPRQITNAQLIAACCYHMSTDAMSTSNTSKFAEGLELLDAKTVFSIIQVEVDLPDKGYFRRPSITPSRSILLETSYHCIDSIVEAVKDFPRYNIDILIQHHMNNWDENWKRSQRASHCRPAPSRTQAVPPTSLTLSSSSIQLDHPAVIEAKSIIQHCIDTTYNDVKSLLPIVSSFCFLFHEKEENIIETLMTTQKEMTEKAGLSLFESNDTTDVAETLMLFHDIDFDYSIHRTKIQINYSRLIKIQKKLNMALTEKNYLPFFAISLKKCVLLINEKIIELIESQKIEILDQCENLIRIINNEFEAMARNLIVVPNDANELRLLSDLYNKCTSRRILLHSRIKYELKGLVDILNDLNHVYHVKNQIQISNCWSWPKKSSYFFRKNQKIIKDKRNEMAAELNHLITLHEREMKALESDVKGMRRCGTLREEQREVMNEKLMKCRNLSIKLNSSSHEINKLEVILNPEIKITNYHKRLKVVETLLVPYEMLWSTIESYYVNIESWRHQKLSNMNAKQTMQELSVLKRNLKKSRQFLRKQNGTSPLRAVDELLDLLNEFECNEAPLITMFATKALKQSHWEQISQKTDIDEIKHQTRRRSMADLNELGLLQHVNDIQEIVMNAKKEMSAETILNDMKEAWHSIYFTIQTIQNELHNKTSNSNATPANDGQEQSDANDEEDAYVLMDVNNNMRTLLDEQITQTDGMKGSCRFEALIPIILQWEITLNQIDQILISVNECQKLYIYLFPLFTNLEIRSQMGLSSGKFDVSEHLFQKTLNKMAETPMTAATVTASTTSSITTSSIATSSSITSNTNSFSAASFSTSTSSILNVISIIAQDLDAPRIVMDMTECIEHLEAVRIKLKSWLDHKRSIFPRFYFLSDNEMLHLLSINNSINPNDVVENGVLQNLFNGVSNLIMTRQNIHLMQDEDGTKETNSKGKQANQKGTEGTEEKELKQGQHQAGLLNKTEKDKQLNETTVVPTDPSTMAGLQQWVILGISSFENEKLLFKKSIGLNEMKVETWLDEIEWSMKTSIGQNITQALVDQETVQRDQWMFSYPIQIIVTCESISLTRKLEECFTSKSSCTRKLREMESNLTKGMHDLVVAIRHTTSSAASSATSGATSSATPGTTQGATPGTATSLLLQRSVLEHLLLLNISTKNKIEMLISINTTSLHSFDLQCHMRYYWKPHAGHRTAIQSSTIADDDLEELDNKNIFDVLDSHKEKRIQQEMEDENENNENQIPLEDRIDEVNVSMMSTTIQYDNEYIGSSIRLVTTPLVLRCQRTLMTAFVMNNSVYASGASGNGKTEILKDLSNSLGRQIRTMQCTSKFLPIHFNNFFKGLVTTGAWCVFDSFNMIPSNVLSIVATQIINILNAKKNYKQLMELDGDYFKMDWNCFIYCAAAAGNTAAGAGTAAVLQRTVLPDNLSLNMRRIVLHRPNRDVICTVLLQTYGYQENEMLSSKIISVCTLLAVQLKNSKQYRHYNFENVRILMLILKTCKKWMTMAMHQYPDITHSENELVLNALNEILPSTLTSNQDKQLFHFILRDTFPGLNVEQQSDKTEKIQFIKQLKELKNETKEDDNIGSNSIGDNSSGNSGIGGSSSSDGMVFSKESMSKMYEIYQATHLKSGICILGETGIGKTAMLSTLSKMYDIQCSETITPSSMTMNELYGTFNEVTSEWIDGVLPHVFRQQIQHHQQTEQLQKQKQPEGIIKNVKNKKTIVESSSSSHSWFILDGSVTSNWSDGLNTVLDNNKKNNMCLMSGEILPMHSNMHVVIETDLLDNANPSTITRVAVIYLPKNILSWDIIYNHWLAKNMKIENSIVQTWDKHMLKSVKELFQWLGWTCCRYVASMSSSSTSATSSSSSTSSSSTSSETTKVQLRALHGFHLLLRTFHLYLNTVPEYTTSCSKEERKMYEGQIEGTFIFALVWSVGASIEDETQRLQLILFIKACLHSSSTLKNKYSHIHRQLKTIDRWKQPSFYDKGTKFRQLKIQLPDHDNWYNYRFVVNENARPKIDNSGDWIVWSDFIGQLPVYPNSPRDALPPSSSSSPSSNSSTSTSFHNNNRTVMIPTSSTTALCSHLDLLLEHEENNNHTSLVPFSKVSPVHILMSGTNGSGKSTIVNNCLRGYMARDTSSRAISTVVHTRTTTASVLRLTLNQLFKRRKGNAYGYEKGKTLKLFIEDININQQKEGEEQQNLKLNNSHEIIRDMLDHNSLWSGNVNSNEAPVRQTLVDVSVIATLRPSTTCTTLSSRLLRHFFIISIKHPDEKDMYKIFTAVMKNHLMNIFPNNDEMNALDFSIINATYQVHAYLVEHMKPTPLQSHYKFNTFSIFNNCIQGMLLTTKKSFFPPKNKSSRKVPTVVNVCRVWCNEMSRAYVDRLRTEKDRSEIRKVIADNAIDCFDLEVLELFPLHAKSNMNKPEPSLSYAQCVDHIFIGNIDCTFIQEDQKDVKKKKPKTSKQDKKMIHSHYKELTFKALEKLFTTKKFTLKYPNILFQKYLIQHVLNIVRSISNYQHMLLIGTSGKQTAIRLASTLLKRTVLQITNNNLFHTQIQTSIFQACQYQQEDQEEEEKKEEEKKEEEKKEEEKKEEEEEETKSNGVIVVMHGPSASKTMFSFLTTQFIYSYENFMKYTSGTIELIHLIEDARMNITKMYGIKYEQELNDEDVIKLHLVPRMNQRLSFIVVANQNTSMSNNSTYITQLLSGQQVTVDYYIDWQETELKELIHASILKINIGNTKSQQKKIENFIFDFHTDTKKRNNTNPTNNPANITNNAVVPITTSTLFHLLALYTHHLEEKRHALNVRRNRYKTGLEKLIFSEKSIDVMNKGLKRLLPKIEKLKMENDILMKVIEERLPSVELARKEVQEKTEIAVKEKKRVQEIQMECETDLKEALPLLEDATNALNTLQKKDIDEVKSYRNPPEGVLLVMEAVCIMLSVTPERIPDPNDPSRKIDEWWSSSKRLLGESSMLNQLSNYDKDHMDIKIMSKIRTEYIDNPLFDEESLSKISLAATGLCLWVRAMECYDRAYRIVVPKRLSLEEASEALLEQEEMLEVLRDELKIIEKDLKALTNKQEKSLKKMQLLIIEEESCRLQLIRAEEILLSLGSERDRWRSEVDYCTECATKLPGDLLFASCILSHTGHFSLKNKNELLDLYVQKMKKIKIIHTGQIFEKKSSLVVSRIMSNTIKIKQWYGYGLPKDSFTVETAIIGLNNGKKFPLFIDPHGRVVQWIQKMEKQRVQKYQIDKKQNNTKQNNTKQNNTEQNNIDVDSGEYNQQEASFVVLHPNDPHLLRDLIVAAECGTHVLIENVDTYTDTFNHENHEIYKNKKEHKQENKNKNNKNNNEKKKSKSISDSNTSFSFPPCLYQFLLRTRRLRRVDETFSSNDSKYVHVLQSLPQSILEEASSSFYLYMTTTSKLSAQNCSSSSFFFSNINVCNMNINKEGTQEQLLDIIVNHEQYELQKNKTALEKENTKYLNILHQMEENILMTLSETKGNLLENTHAIETLSSSKTLSIETKTKQKRSKVMEIKLDKIRSQYLPVAIMAQRILFVVYKLSHVNMFYNFNMTWYSTILKKALTISSNKNKTSSDTSINTQYVTIIHDHLIQLLLTNISKSIFTKDVKLLPILIAIEELRHDKAITKKEYQCLLFDTNLIISDKEMIDIVPTPKPDFISNSTAWNHLERLSTLPAFKGVSLNVTRAVLGSTAWKKYMLSEEPEKIPPPVRCVLNEFQQLLILKCLRKDRLACGIDIYLYNRYGASVLDPPVLNLNQIISTCTNTTSAATKSTTKSTTTTNTTSMMTPILFLLSNGTDPTNEISILAKTKKIRLNILSMGYQNEEIAESMIRKSKTHGEWTILNNCHLVPDWLHRLQHVCDTTNNYNKEDEKDDKEDDKNKKKTGTKSAIHKNCRLMLTTLPTSFFPSWLIRNSVKITMEEPNGIRSNMLRLYSSSALRESFLYDEMKGTKGEMFRRLLYSLCLFHCTINERNMKYDAIGSISSYLYNDSDLFNSLSQLHSFIRNNKTNTSPVTAFKYITGTMNYCGQISNANDQNVIHGMLSRFCNDEMLFGQTVNKNQNNSNSDVSDIQYQYTLDSSNTTESSADITTDLTEDSTTQWSAPPTSLLITGDQYVEYIQQNINLNNTTSTTMIVGFNMNGNTYHDTKQTNSFLNSLIQSEENNNNDTNNNNTKLLELPELLEELPELFDTIECKLRCPIKYEEAYNTVIQSEMSAYNTVILTMRQDIHQLQNAIQGKEAMTVALKELHADLNLNVFPNKWVSITYPTLKNYSDYVLNLKRRISFLLEWYKKGKVPATFWIGGLFYIKSFLYSTLQRYSRKKTINIEHLTWSSQLMKKEKYETAPRSGIYITGLFFEGGTWDSTEQLLLDSPRHIFVTKCPVILMKPIPKEEVKIYPYECPVYRTKKRQEKLNAATTNHVCQIQIPTKQTQEYWEQRGCALLVEV